MVAGLPSVDVLGPRTKEIQQGCVTSEGKKNHTLPLKKLRSAMKQFLQERQGVGFFL